MILSVALNLSSERMRRPNSGAVVISRTLVFPLNTANLTRIDWEKEMIFFLFFSVLEDENIILRIFARFKALFIFIDGWNLSQRRPGNVRQLSWQEIRDIYFIVWLFLLVETKNRKSQKCFRNLFGIFFCFFYFANTLLMRPCAPVYITRN